MRKDTVVGSTVKRPAASESDGPAPAGSRSPAGERHVPSETARRGESEDTEARPARRRNPRGEGGRLRAEILAAGVSLAGRLGSVEAVSLRAVAREVGITPMSIYSHFETKEELIWALIDSEFAALAGRLDRAGADQADPVGRLRARSLAYVRFGLENPGSFLVLFGTTGRPAPPGEEPEQLPGWPVFAGFVSAIEDCVLAGRAPRVDPRSAATRLWAALHGMTVLRVSKKAFPWPPAAQLVDDLLTDLVLDSAARTT
ncbi:MAG TPA: TetR/AcrR family transcriptional regulator [Streptosporangiaceae bacterium]|nr:TetR/AcrR family transcriptional regulator [Streptosporangiaceae bacterium]